MITTPIVDFVKEYNARKGQRLHMPGHKGISLPYIDMPYCYDITEITGADNLYNPDGIIARSEANASKLFGCQTVYSTEGSSQCIKAMLYLALIHFKMTHRDYKGRPYVIAARNVHRAFIHAAALLDLDVVWLMPSEKSDVCTDICTCPIDINALTELVSGNNRHFVIRNNQSPQGSNNQSSDNDNNQSHGSSNNQSSGDDNNQSFCNSNNQLSGNSNNQPPIGVYITYPDYLGSVNDLAAIAKLCHENDTLLLVDSAHGAYFRFLDKNKYPKYPFAAEHADIACTSAHKTLPVLTGGAYLHVSDNLKEVFPIIKKALALFGSSSPSYLILTSLDACNRYLAEGYVEELNDFCEMLNGLREALTKNGWKVLDTDPLRVSVCIPKEDKPALLERLHLGGIEPEYIGEGVCVLLFTPSNLYAGMHRTNVEAMLSNTKEIENKDVVNFNYKLNNQGSLNERTEVGEFFEKIIGAFGLCHGECATINRSYRQPKSVMSIREAYFDAESVKRPEVLTCPPAIPEIMVNEVLEE